MIVNKTARKQITPETIEIAVKAFRDMLEFRLREKGYGTFASRHEVLGVVAAEMNELTNAVEHENIENVEHELLDVAVGCVFGVACIKAETLDW